LPFVELFYICIALERSGAEKEVEDFLIACLQFFLSAGLEIR
jgi:hypothetical protein